jgi:hypothetical protein
MLPLVTIIAVILWTMINGAFLALMPLLIIFPNIFIMAAMLPVLVIGSHYDIIMYQMYGIYLNIKFLLILLISMLPLIAVIIIAKKAIYENALIVYLLFLYSIFVTFPPIMVIIALLPLIVIAAHYDV